MSKVSFPADRPLFLAIRSAIEDPLALEAPYQLVFNWFLFGHFGDAK